MINITLKSGKCFHTVFTPSLRVAGKRKQFLGLATPSQAPVIIFIILFKVRGHGNIFIIPHPFPQGTTYFQYYSLNCQFSLNKL